MPLNNILQQLDSLLSGILKIDNMVEGEVEYNVLESKYYEFSNDHTVLFDFQLGLSQGDMHDLPMAYS